MRFGIPKLRRRTARRKTDLLLPDDTKVIKEPKPFDPNWSRYCPQLSFPPYRHIPGVTPHPIRDPEGHSYGLEESINAPVLPPETWREDEDYLHGVDLYNFAYWWEAHEVWEGLWRQAEGDYRLFLQALIQVSAALIKYHMRMPRPVRTLSIAGREKLQKVLQHLTTPTEIYMGINLSEFLTCLDTFFDPFYSDSVSEKTYMHLMVKPLIRLHF